MAIADPPRLVAVPTGPSGGWSEADRAVVWLRGEHDLATVTGVAENLARAIGLDDDDLVVDLSGVTFMDGSTVGVIVRVREFLRLRARSLTLRDPSICARRLLDLCGLTDLVVARPAA